ncbi:MAG TPA: histone deacetylase [Solirubrobacteraceae bacterium]|nr:histone deacetylase [Solirubrobacteraceae bacterium]
MTACLYFSDPVCLEHDPSALWPGHPESPQRLVAIERALAARARPRWERRRARPADEEQLHLVHSAAHVRAVMALCAAGGGAIDADTLLSERSCAAALHAAGAACAMTRALLAGEGSAGFCAVRPPGHHAEPRRAMGFCLFNNVAIAAELALAELGAGRVFILDWDVHHGNGTAEIFRRRADVLYASIHQAPFYPGTGPLEDAGCGEGEGFTINLPVPAGSGGELWVALLAHVVLPAAVAFAPDLVLVSAGFDAHAEDPLAACELQTAAFAEMARRVRALASAAAIPVGAVLEGGYNPPVLGECVGAVLDALAGEDEGGEEAQFIADVDELPEVARALAQVRRYWPL